MYTCSDCRDLLWDFVYGLLEPAQTQALQAHLAYCAICQDELEAARSGRVALKQAALLDLPVPEFVPPEDEPAAVPFDPATPRPAALSPRKNWLASLAAAAAVLLALGLPYGLYRHGLAPYEADLAAARDRAEQAGAERDSVQRQVTAERLTLVNTTRSGALRLQVTGPTVYQPGALNQLRITTTDLAGKPVTARVSVGLADPARPEDVLFESGERECRGDLLLTLPADLPRTDLMELRLRVTARTGAGREARVQADLPVGKPAYVTHLAFSKAVYHPGERLFFRSLTVDRHTLRPAAKPLSVGYRLTGPDRERKRGLAGVTLEGGLGGGEFDIDPKWAEGEYTLTLTDYDQQLPPQEWKFQVRRASALGLREAVRFDRPVYRPGETVGVEFEARRPDGSGAGDVPVKLTLEVGEDTVGTPVQTQTNAAGLARAAFVLPKEMAGEAKLTLRAGKGVKSDIVVRPVPVIGSRLAVDFFPEGGELVADVPNRVYVRARTPAGMPVELRGQLVDGQGRSLAAVRTAGGHGLGVFEITPRPGETYALHVESPAGITDRPALPEALAGGLGLQIPGDTTRPGEPVRVVLHHRGSPRPVLVAAFARGQLVAQQLVTLKPDTAEVLLEPAAPTAGVLRVTVYDPVGGVPRPVAERLVYRLPAERLDLQLTPGKEKYRPGERVELHIQGRNEKGEAEPAWLLASVVTDGAAAGTPGLSAYFHLLSEVREPANLERAEIVPGADPKAAEVLDLFLGTQRARSFVAAAPEWATPTERAADILFLDNLGAVERRFAAALGELDRRVAEQTEAAAQREREARAASTALIDYQNQVRRYARAGVGAVALSLLAAGLGLLALAIWRVAHGTRTVPYFAGSLAALVLCALGLLFPPPAEAPVLQQGNDVQIAGAGPKWVPSDRRLVDTVPDLPRVLESRPSSALAQLPTRSRSDSLAYVRVPDQTQPSETAPRVLPLHGDDLPPKVELKPLPLRAYVHAQTPAADGRGTPDLLLWHPTLFAADGTAQVEFDLPSQPATYRIVIHGHTATGRVGTVQAPLVSKP
jgi:alpha-2-macroglobulin-like protein